MIELSNIVKRYGDKYAVNNISFKVEPGEIVGFLGPNGAGKSTTMNILTGYLSATSGRARIDGIDILENPLEAKSRIGFLPEMPPLYLDMTVKEYLDFVYDLKHCTLDRKEHIAEICKVVKIEDVYGRIIKNLSKGYRQRVGIAQALIGNPKVLIFDEPTVGLDPKQIIDIRNLIKSLGGQHTVILSTHILPEVQAVCDRIIIINEGVIVANEKAQDIYKAVRPIKRYNITVCGDEKSILDTLRNLDGVTYAESLSQRGEGEYSFLIESDGNIEIRKPMFYALAQKSMPILELCEAQANLEDIFISLVEDGGKGEK